MMKKLTVILFTCTLFAGCLTQKRAARQLGKIQTFYPDLISTVNDTIIEVWEVEKLVPIPADSFQIGGTWDSSKLDSLLYTHTDTLYRVDLKFLKDTLEVVKWKVRVKREKDTIYLTVRDTIQKNITTTEVVTKIENKVPWYLWLLLFLLVGSLITSLIKRK